jgi:hypothetical protein
MHCITTPAQLHDKKNFWGNSFIKPGTQNCVSENTIEMVIPVSFG